MWKVLQSLAQDPRERGQKKISKNYYDEDDMNFIKKQDKNGTKSPKQYTLTPKDNTVEDEDEEFFIDFQNNLEDVIDNKIFEFNEFSTDPGSLLDHYMHHNVVVFSTDCPKKDKKIRSIQKKFLKKYDVHPFIVNLSTHPQGDLIRDVLVNKYGDKKIFVVVKKNN